jgi:ligand-binding sensor domain-containing protein
MKNFFLFLAFLISTVQSLTAQWQPTEGIYGSSIGKFVIKGTNIFVGTAKGMYLSTNNGDSWTAFYGIGLPEGYCSPLAKSDADIYVTTSKGLYVSNNNGTNWRPVGTNGLTVSSITALAINGATLFAGTTNGIFRSTNNGNNWTEVTNGVVNTNNTLNQASINSITLSDNRIFVLTNDKIYVSSNNGNSWTKINTGITDRSGASALFFSSIFVNGANLVVSTQGNGVYLSTNNGATWTNSSLQNAHISSLTSDNSTLYASSWNGVFKSTDNGLTWTLKRKGITKPRATSVAVNGTTIFVGTSGGIFASNDGGDNWVSKNNGFNAMQINSLVSDGTNAFAGTINAVYRSINNGATWTETAFRPLTDFQTGQMGNTRGLTMNRTHIFATSENGTYASNNNGDSWTLSNSGIVYDFRIPESNSVVTKGNLVFANVIGAGIVKSDNNGLTWTPANNGIDRNYWGVQAIATDGTRLFAFASRINPAFTAIIYNMYVSNDNGNNWTETLTTANASINSLASSGNNIFVGSYQSIYLSTNGGSSWADIGDALPIVPIPVLSEKFKFINTLVTNNNLLFAGIYANGVYLTTNNGVSWRAINDGLGSLDILKLEISGNYLLAGTATGVFRRPLSDFLTLSVLEKGNFDYTISPNPVSNQLAINCSNELIGKKYAIHNILGETISSNTLTNMNTAVSLDNAPNGVYLLTIMGTTKTLKFVKQ